MRTAKAWGFAAALLFTASCEETTGVQLSVDPLKLYSTAPPAGWTLVTGDERLGLRLPYDWPEKYRVVYDQPFNPWTYQKNVAALCGYGPEAADLAGELFDRMIEYTLIDRQARFIYYAFSYNFSGSVLEEGWVSAFGNGVVLAGTVALYNCFGEDRYLAAATELYEALALTRNGNHAWISETLPDGTTWFEEYPLPNDPQPRVLNGHIYAVFGLYYLFDTTSDPQVLSLLRSGIQAVAAHGAEYRRPGEVNLYDLRPPDTDDYGPARTIAQQDMLCKITGDPVFLDLRDLFASDMPDAASTVTVDCEL